VTGSSSLTCVSLDGVENGGAQAVMHQSVSSPNTPERCGSYHVSRTLSRVLDDAVASSNVVQRKIAERMDDLISEGGGYYECSAVDDRAWSGSGEVTCVTNSAANRIEQRVATCDGGRNGTPSGCARRRHEIGKREHVITVVFGIGHWIERSS